MSALAAVMACAQASAVEVEFWQRYNAPDDSVWLLAGFDQGDRVVGTAQVTTVRRQGSVEDVEGRFGRAIRLDGHSGLKLTTGQTFRGGTVAIEAWIRLDAYPQDRAYVVSRPANVDGNATFDPAVDVTKGFGLFVDQAGALHMEITNCGYGNTTLTSSKPGAVSLGRWVHVAGVSANFPIGFRRLFVDGEMVAEESITWGKGLVVHGDEESQPGPVYIGNRAGGDAGLIGAIDQVRIHPRIAKFWPREDDAWTNANRPGAVPSGSPHFLDCHAPALYLPLDGDLSTPGTTVADLQADGTELFDNGVCGKAMRGRLELSAPELVDLDEGTIEFWLMPGGVNSYSDWNHGFLGGPFTLYILNSPGLRYKPLSLYYRRPDGELNLFTAAAVEIRPGRWYHLLVTWRGNEVSVYCDGQPGGRSFGVPLPRQGEDRFCRRLTVGSERSLVDEVRLYHKCLSAEEAANAYHRYRDPAKLVAPKPCSVHVRGLYYPSKNQVVCRLEPESDDVIKAKLTLRNSAGEEFLECTRPIDAGEHTLEVPDLPNGKYTLVAEGITRDGRKLPGGEFRFRRHHFPWENNTLGISDEVYPPLEPLRTSGNRISMVGREYELNSFGLPERIVSAGKDLLAGPIVLRCETSDGESQWEDGPLRWTTSKPSQAVFEAQTTTPTLQVRTRSTIEPDGCMKVEVTLLPGPQPAAIERLWIEVPLLDAEAPLMHTVTAGLRQNYSGVVPQGEGVVWDGAKAHQYQRWLNAFVPYVWLGSPHRGLAWFAENDRGWITQKTPEATIQEIVRHGDRLVLRVYLINYRAVIEKPHELVFGLQASPTKLMADGWRARLPDAPGGLAVVPWGGLECASQGPFRDDWRIVEKILEAREGKPIDVAWFEHYEQTEKPPLVHGNSPWAYMANHFAQRAKEAGLDRPVAVYQEEMRGCPARSEWAIFQDEWTTHPNRYQRTELPDRVFERGYESLSHPEHITFPRSYQDFGCSIANEWLRRGVSLYWDNTYPYWSVNTRTTVAYVAEDGRVQPCMIIWNHREYAKRVWNLLAQWRRRRPEPLEFTLHMTNTLLLPVHTWGTVNLDHELDTEKPFPPDWLRTETIGLQVGNMPLSLYNLTGKQQKALEGLTQPQKDLTEWGMRAVHEIGHRDGPMEELLHKFGYGTDDCVVYNYWAKEPVLRVEPATVKWLLVSNPGENEALIVLASWSDKPERVTIELLRDVPGVPADGKLFDVTSAADAEPWHGRRFDCELQYKYCVKVIRLTGG